MVELKQQVDFYDLGVKYAKYSPNDIKIEIGYILVNYGKKEAEEFLIGLASQIPEKLEKYNHEECIRLSKIHGTCGFGVDGLRNNSYFGGDGISHECDCKGRYKEPKGKKLVKVKKTK